MHSAVLILSLSLHTANAGIDLGKVGAVDLPNSCVPQVQADFGRGVALLHSFFYEEARIIFTDIARRDPSCAMAFWGIAMTYYHALWAPPLGEDMAPATDAADRAAALPVKTDIERGLIASTTAYWHGKLKKTEGPAPQGVSSCHGGAPAPAGPAEAFRDVLQALHDRHPDDVEVTSFYALGLLGTAAKEDRTLSQQKKAASLLEAMWATHPNHPGVVHYLIHAYDYPETARLGLPAARAYAEIAPRVPHALHMPSHIFVRLGMWPEDEKSNVASIAAAAQWIAVRQPGRTLYDSLHAMDYLEYGYLQQGREEDAAIQVKQMGVVDKVYPAWEFSSAFARAVVPARFALEREHWADAAVLKVSPIAAWDRYPFVRGLIEYAHAIGAARIGDVKRARVAVSRLDGLEKGIPAGPLSYFGKLMDSYRLAANGWISHIEKNDKEAVQQLTQAADLEDALGPHPVSPGPLLPARELLGDLFLALGRADDARHAYEATLALYPGRLRSVAGAMRAAKLAGDGGAAGGFARQLLAMAEGGNGPMVREARELVR